MRVTSTFTANWSILCRSIDDTMRHDTQSLKLVSDTRERPDQRIRQKRVTFSDEKAGTAQSAVPAFSCLGGLATEDI